MTCSYELTNLYSYLPIDLNTTSYLKRDYVKDHKQYDKSGIYGQYVR